MATANPKPDAMIGQPFGEWVVVEFARKSKRGYHYRCRCSCGKEKVIYGGSLRSGRSSSCGHLSRTKHGHAHRGKHHPLFDLWGAMHNRCRNPRANDYHCYGGRGIKVCDRWKDFQAFLDDMGPRPSSKHSLDRYPDNDGNYEPGNVRWATPAEQAKNKRTTVMLTHGGRTMCLLDWCRELGINQGSVHPWMQRHGLTAYEVLFEPHKIKSKQHLHCLTVDGQTRTITEWAKIVGLDSFVIFSRIRRGWTPEEAIKTPVRQRGGIAGS